MTSSQPMGFLSPREEDVARYVAAVMVKGRDHVPVALWRKFTEAERKLLTVIAREARPEL